MSHPIRFQDHTTFHVQVLRVSLAGAAFSLLFYLVGLAMPLNTQPAQVMTSALIAVLLGLAALPPGRAGLITTLALTAALGLLGAFGRHALAIHTYPWFGVGALGIAAGIIATRDLRDHRRFVVPVATGLTMALATWADGVFRGQVPLTDYVPPFLAEPVYGGVFGFLVSIGLIARQFVIERDTVIEAFEKVRPTLSGEMKDLSERAMELYGRIREVLRDRKEKGGENEGLAKVVCNLVLNVLHLGPKWNEVERGIGPTSSEDLTRRIEELELKISESGDEVARRQYAMAKEALGSQLRYLQDISRSRERVVARVHNYLATLERLHLAVVNHRGADTAKFSDEVQPILDEINTLGHEMDFASEAMREVAEVAEAAAEKKAGAAAAEVAEVAKPAEPGPEPTPAPLALQPPAASPIEAGAEAEPVKQADPEADLAARAFEK